MNSLECLSVFDGLLCDYGNKFAQMARERGCQGEPPTYAMLWAFEFGQRTIAAIAQLVPNSDFVLLTNTLARPFYELANQLLWAAREDHGWERFQRGVARQDLKWANDAERMPELSDHARTIKAARQEVLNRRGEHGEQLTDIPSLAQVLLDNEKRDIAIGELSAPGAAAFNYSNLYRMLCRPSHGHIPALADTPPHFALVLTILAVGLATHATLRALYHLLGEPTDFGLEDAGNEVERAFRAIKTLRLEDFASCTGSGGGTAEH